MGFLPSYPSMVIYGSMAGTAGFIFTFSFFGICSTFYRDSSPLQPPTRALGAALALLAPLAALLASLVYLAESNHLGVTADVTPAGTVACLCGTPLLMWLPATTLTAYTPFREANMPLPPLARPSASAEEVSAAEAEVQAAPVLGEGKCGAGALEPTAATEEEASPSTAQAKKED